MNPLSPEQNNLRNALRKKLQAQRAALTKTQLETAEADLLKNFQSCWQPLISGGQIATASTKSPTKALKVAGYLATGGELSPALCLSWLRELGHQTYLPVVRQKLLKFALLDEHTEFTNGKYDIDIPLVREESLLPASALDIVLVPLVGFDLEGGRMGMGGGYYDRSFAFILASVESARSKQTRSQGLPLMLGIAHEIQLQEKIPVASWDIPLNAAVTDQTHYQML